MKLRLVLVLSTAFLPMAAIAQSAMPNLPNIVVKGHAEKEVDPNRFKIELRVSTADKTPAVARKNVEARMAQVLDAFRAHHALPATVHATSMEITQDVRFVDGQSRSSGTRVTRSADAVFTSIEDLRGFVDAIPADEVLQITNTSTTRDDLPAIKRELRRAAAEDSKANATELAASYGVRVGPLYTVSAQPLAGVDRTLGGYDRMFMAFAPPAPPAPSANITRLQAGSFTVSEDIYALYLIQPANL